MAISKLETDAIADDAVVTAKVADNAVTSAKLPDGGVAIADLSTDTGITTNYHKVPAFADDAARNTAISSPAVGMMIYNTDRGVIQQYNSQGWDSIASPPTVTSLDYPGSTTALDPVGEYTDATCDYNNDPTITHDTNTKMRAGMLVTGTGIPTGATIASVTSNTAFELSVATTGGAVTNGTLTFNTETLIITGTNFQTGATITIDNSTPSTVTRNSSTQLTATGMPAKTAGTYAGGLEVTNPTGLSANINVDYSGFPAWQTASGNVLSTFITGSAITTIDLDATSATSYALTTGSLAPGLAMSTSTGDITGTITGSTYTTYNFTVTATDAEAQSAPRLFNIITAALPTDGDAVRDYQHAGTGTTYRIHIFTTVTTSGSFDTGAAIANADVFILGGGGSGGNGLGGGGAGGAIVYQTGYTIPAGDHVIKVGAGGATQSTANAGGNYGIFSSLALDGGTEIKAIGGGGGGSEGTADATKPQGWDSSPAGVNWGNGGGGGYNHNGWEPNTHPTYSGWTIHANYDGGDGSRIVASSGFEGAGGASAKANGSDGVAGTTIGHGGEGLNSITWLTPRAFGYAGTHNSVTIDNSFYWAAGGGGSVFNSGTAGNGGKGGAGGGAANSGTAGNSQSYSLNAGVNGTAGQSSAGNVGGAAGANTGSGGGGGAEADSAGGAGGSGIVVIRYPI